MVTNTHAESGSGEHVARALQLSELSRGHEYSADKMHILIGDFNVRQGEDECLFSQGWRDVEENIDDWTWSDGSHHARYDRVYLHNSTTTRARCTVIQRLPNVWGLMTDHVPLHAVVRGVPFTRGVPSLCAALDGPVAAASATEAGDVAIRRAGGTRRQQCSTPQPAEELPGSSQQRSDTPVVSIATDVQTEILEFRKMAQLWEEDPVSREDVQEQSLTAWKEIPTACGFRAAKPRRNGAQRWATPADKLAQQQQYAKCLAWASECGLTEAEFHSNLEAVPTDQRQRGGSALPASLRIWKNGGCTYWEHARRLCVSVSISTVAANAGRRLGGEAVATQAAEEVSELLSSEAFRLSRLLAIPKRWRADQALRLPDDSHRLSSGIKSLPGFFEMWLRDQGAALMGQRAAENWRTLVQQEAQSLCLPSEGLSQRRADSKPQAETSERPPSQFVLDGAHTVETIHRDNKGAGRQSVSTAWHGFLWETACDEVHTVASNGSV